MEYLYTRTIKQLNTHGGVYGMGSVVKIFPHLHSYADGTHTDPLQQRILPSLL